MIANYSRVVARIVGPSTNGGGSKRSPDNKTPRWWRLLDRKSSILLQHSPQPFAKHAQVELAKLGTGKVQEGRAAGLATKPSR